MAYLRGPISVTANDIDLISNQVIFSKHRQPTWSRVGVQQESGLQIHGGRCPVHQAELHRDSPLLHNHLHDEAVDSSDV